MSGSRWDQAEAEAGPRLDRLIELRVFGRKPISDVPPYSTSDDAAELVIARLARPPLRWMSLKDGEQWMFHWRIPVAADPEATASRYEKLASATAATRPLAICRAALTLLGPLGGPGRSLPAQTSTPPNA